MGKLWRMTKFSCQATGESEANGIKCSAPDTPLHLLPAFGEEGTAPELRWAGTHLIVSSRERNCGLFPPCGCRVQVSTNFSPAVLKWGQSTSGLNPP